MNDLSAELYEKRKARAAAMSLAAGHRNSADYLRVISESANDAMILGAQALEGQAEALEGEADYLDGEISRIRCQQRAAKK